MIKIWYDMAWSATFVHYGKTTLRFTDREEPWGELTQIIEAYHPEGSTGIGKMEVPYSDEIWNALLAEGTIIDDD